MGVSSGINLLGPTRNHKHLLEKDRGVWLQRRRNVTRELDAAWLTLKMEQGAMSHRTQLQRPERRRGNRFPHPHPQPPEGAQPWGPLDFNPMRPVLDSDTQKCKRNYFCCIKPLRLWSFVKLPQPSQTFHGGSEGECSESGPRSRTPPLTAP